MLLGPFEFCILYIFNIFYAYFTKFLYFSYLFIYLSILYIMSWIINNFNFMQLKYILMRKQCPQLIFLQAKYYWHLKKVLHSFTCHYFLEKVLVRRCFFLKISIFGSFIFLTPMFKLLVIFDFPLALKGSVSSVCLEEIIRARLVYNLATFEGRYRAA